MRIAAVSIVCAACAAAIAVRVFGTLKVVSTAAYSHPLTIGGTSLRVAVATTEAEREQGLSDTQELQGGQGMLFAYDSPQKPLFWMKDMRYPLDMIWIGSDKKVEHVTVDAEPKDFPKTYGPTSDIQYVLEVPAGFAASHGIADGTPVAF